MLGKSKAMEDLKFLVSQRTDRVAKMANHDKNYEKKVLIHNKKKESAVNYESKMSNQLKKQFEVVKGSESDEVEEIEGTDSDFTLQESSAH